MLIRAVGERGEQIFENGGFLEREVDFPVFGPLDLFGLRNNVVLCGKGYAWAPVLGSFDNSKRYGSSPTWLFSVLRVL